MRLERQVLACDFDDGVEALDYWRRRRARLAWYKRRARREADAMIDAWERRIRSVVLRDPYLPAGQRLEAGWLVVRARAGLIGRRWARRASVAAVSMSAAAGAGFAAVAGLF